MLNFVKYSLLLVLGVTFSVTVVAQNNVIRISTPTISSAVNEVEETIIAVYEQLGYQAKVIKTPAKRSLIEVSQGKFDAELGRVEAAQTLFTDFIRIPVPIMSFNILAISAVDVPTIKLWTNLPGFDVVTLRGFVGITERLNQHNVNYHKTSDVKQILQMLRSKRAQVAIVPAVLMEPYQASLTNSIDYSAIEIIDTLPVYHYIHKKHVKIVPKFTEKLKVMLKLAKIENR